MRRQRQHVFRPLVEGHDLDAVMGEFPQREGGRGIPGTDQTGRQRAGTAVALAPVASLAGGLPQRRRDVGPKRVQVFEQQRGAGAALESALVRAGHGRVHTLGAAEQLARLQRLGNRGAGEHLEVGRARAPRVDRARDQLAVASLRPEQDHGKLGPRGSRRLGDQLTRRLAGADDAILAAAPRRIRTERGRRRPRGRPGTPIELAHTIHWTPPQRCAKLKRIRWVCQCICDSSEEHPGVVVAPATHRSRPLQSAHRRCSRRPPRSSPPVRGGRSAAGDGPEPPLSPSPSRLTRPPRELPCR